MCVIFLAESARVTEEELRAAWEHNCDGGGAAWRKAGLVSYVKGVNLNKLLALAKDLPLPYVLHVRYATVGGKDRRLAHPFPLNAEASLELKGNTARGVLFHNGHYAQWEKDGQPKGVVGPWSDSRFLTWQHEGIKDLDRMATELAGTGPGRFVIYTPERILRIGQFHEVMSGVFASNVNYKKTTSLVQGPDMYSQWLAEYRASKPVTSHEDWMTSVT